ncbi:MAG: SLC13 family permease [Candidatus Rokubacteria bacterium]|nr:SLC13 family permease [Candidatus Rokubacteria bacterium]
MGFEPQAVLVLAVLVGVLVLLGGTRLSPDLVLLAGVTVLLTAGVLSQREALAGLANEGMITVAILFVVAAGMRETGALASVLEPLLGRPRSTTVAQARLMGPVAFMSAFLNNTPIVAMLIPVVTDWAKRRGVSVSKLLLPLSYATILGGTCTLIGTSTNLVVYGLLLERLPAKRLGLFEIAWVGVPCALVGLAWVLLASRWLLPERRPAAALFADPREYTVEMLVEPGSPLAGRTIEEAGLRHLAGVYLMEIDRDGEVLPAVASSERLRAGDRLVFTGVVDSVVDLQKIRGLMPATDQVFKLDGDRSRRHLVEAVVSDSCPLVGRTIREGRFRAVYAAAVIAVARNGERIRQRIGDIVLRAGDTLLLEADPRFAEQQRNSRDFFLVSAIPGSQPLRHERAWVAGAILLGLVVAAGSGLLSMLNAAALAAGLMIATRCLRVSEARRSVDWSVLTVIAASFAVSRAVETTGLAAWLVEGLVGVAGAHPWRALALISGVTMLCNAVMTNNAAAVLLFPIAVGTAERLGVSAMPFAVGLMMAGSNDFATPIGYQTNLMVYGPGGYRFSDYLRLGGPLNLLSWATAVFLIPFLWPF